MPSNVETPAVPADEGARHDTPQTPHIKLTPSGVIVDASKPLDIALYQGVESNMARFSESVRFREESRKSDETQRDDFAAAALNGLVSQAFQNGSDNAPKPARLADIAFKIADAMMAERAKRANQ